jgi:hypothetical protein
LATKNLVKKLQKKYNKEDIVVIKRVNEALVVTEGNMKNIKGEYKVNVIGHGDEDKRGVMRQPSVEHGFCMTFRIKVNSIVVTFNFYSVII